MPSNQDSIYARRPWNSLPETIVDEALAYYTRPANQIALTRPPIPNIGRTPARFGYDNRQIGIRDIATLDDRYPRVDFTGRVSGYSGTMSPVLGVM